MQIHPNRYSDQTAMWLYAAFLCCDFAFAHLAGCAAAMR